MKTILVILASLFFLTSAFAQLSTTMYVAATGTGKTTAANCVYVSFTASGFSGTIGGAAFSNLTVSIPVMSAYQSGSGQRLNAIPYVVSSGTLIITEVK